MCVKQETSVRYAEVLLLALEAEMKNKKGESYEDTGIIELIHPDI